MSRELTLLKIKSMFSLTSFLSGEQPNLKISWDHVRYGITSRNLDLSPWWDLSREMGSSRRTLDEALILITRSMSSTELRRNTRNNIALRNDTRPFSGELGHICPTFTLWTTRKSLTECTIDLINGFTYISTRLTNLPGNMPGYLMKTYQSFCRVSWMIGRSCFLKPIMGW
jgi:hypothetical protein